MNMAAFLALPREEQDRRLEEQAAMAAAEYEADLALPVEERELTAFTALDEEPPYEYDKEEMTSHAA